MARCLLVVLFLLTSCLFAFDYEVIRNHEGDKDSLSLYLNNREYLCLIGNDPVTTKRVYSFLARFIEQSELQNNPNSLLFRSTAKGGTEIVWQDTTLLVLSDSETLLNEKRQNGLPRLIDFARSIQIDNGAHPISLQAKAKFKPINHVQLSDVAGQAFGAIFPASHPFLPLGTRLRVMNPLKDWSIVVQVVRHDKWVSESSIGINSKAIRALGMEETGAVRTQFI